MSAPSGYTALDFVGFTDKGTYNPLATYMRNDLVHYGGNIWKCLVDNTTGITPVEGANWTLWIGTSANLAERTIAPLLNNPADAAFGVGRQVIYDDWLWEVIAPIAIGDTLIDYAVDPTNANIKKSNPVETQLLAVKAEADATDNMIAPTETNASSSSAAYAVGDQLILNNILYTVTAPVTIGDALVSGTGGNIEASDNLTDQLDSKANSSDLATVATSGSYADLSNKPTLGTAAAKNSTNAVTQSSTDLVESGAVYSEVNTVKQALTNHYKKPTVTPSEILLITDSFGQNPTGNVIMGFNLCIGGTCESIPQGGATYANFATMINGYSGNKNAIKSIIICGGTNERVVADVDSHMESIKTAADTFPNATVYFAFMYSNFTNSGYRALENSILQETINGCGKYGFIFLGNFNDNLYPTYLNVQNDGAHPIPSTGNKLGSAIFNSYLNGIKKALLPTSFDVTDSDFGITFTFYVEPDGAIYVKMSGTTTANLSAGAYHEIPLDTYYYGASLPQSIFSDGLIVKGLGYIIIGLRNNVLQYYFVPLPSGSANIPSGTYLDPFAGILVENGPKLYKVTNS